MDSYLLVTVDCLRRDHVGSYGYDRNTTPNIDKLAADGVRYEYSYANAPGTAWALQTLLSGVYTHQIDGFGLPDPSNGWFVLPTFFKEQGFKTGAFTNNGWLSQDYNYDKHFNEFYGVSDYVKDTETVLRVGRFIDNFINSQRFRKHVARPIYQAIQGLREGIDSGYREGVVDADICDDAITWIKEQQHNGQSYFAWVHLMDAHSPWSRWDNHLKAIRGDTNVPHVIDANNKIEEDEEPPQEVIDTYDAAIRSCDEQIGRLLSTVSEDTTVIVTGDHGEEFGRYGPYHRTSLHSSMTRVPLVISSPKLEPATVSSYPVQHLDIAPTLAAFLNTEPNERWKGGSIINNDHRLDRPIYFSLGTSNPRWGIRRGKWKYIESEKDEETYLFADGHDTHDTNNVRDTYPEIHRKFREKTSEFKYMLEDEKVGGQLKQRTEDISVEIEENLKELGYLE